mmetsp:Transcript_11564/g.23509  ORF Transcript_11564/g.23509 Transcript_11564/m.23509 type:complete len:94 (+) Transcript_11564:545-826(+)
MMEPIRHDTCEAGGRCDDALGETDLRVDSDIGLRSQKMCRLTTQEVIDQSLSVFLYLRHSSDVLNTCRNVDKTSERRKTLLNFRIDLQQRSES